MATFIVEDGTSVANANSYMTVQEFKDYHANAGVATSGLGGTTAIEKLLVVGTRYIEQRWKFQGTEEFTDQPLSFPRRYLYNRNGTLMEGIPERLKNALAEYALYANSGDLFLTPVVSDSSGQGLTRTLIKVGPLTTEKVFSSGNATDSGTVKKYPKADRWLDEFVTAGGGTYRA